LSATSSAASCGKRSGCPAALLYSSTTFRPMT
jgi:hypothetical protein